VKHKEAFVKISDVVCAVPNSYSRILLYSKHAFVIDAGGTVR
jgi:hypothetical protein